MPHINLKKDEFHWWFTHSDQIQNTALIKAYHQMINAEEEERRVKFRFERHRHQHLVTRALVRTTLSHYVNDIAPQNWKFVKNQYGRPDICPSMNLPSLKFNLSHTENLICCGVCLDNEMGVDVENVERISATLDISKRFFSANEYTDLLKVPKHLQKQYFFYYWTLKEAYIKAKGKGIHIPLDQFSYDLKTKDKISVNFDASLGDDPQDWQFMLINIDQKYRSALAINRGKTENMKVDIREVVPLDSEKDLNYRIIAQ